MEKRKPTAENDYKLHNVFIYNEEFKADLLKNVNRSICWHPKEAYGMMGGQTVSLSPSGVYLECETTGFCIFINKERSQIKNYDLAITFFKMYLDETIK